MRKLDMEKVSKLPTANESNVDMNYTSESDDVSQKMSDLVNGWNTFHGSFNYQGAEYPFEINFNYDDELHKVTEATYVAVGTGFKNQITSMVFSADKNHVNITGPSLTISASLGDNGKYVGSMTRGDHSGSIEMYL